MGSYALAMTVTTFSSDCFVCRVHEESSQAYTKAREGSFKPVKPRERACISPCFTVTSLASFKVRVLESYALFHGSRARHSGLVAALAKTLISKPVGLGGAILPGQSQGRSGQGTRVACLL